MSYIARSTYHQHSVCFKAILQGEQATTSSKYEGLGSAMAAKLMIGFWFGIGVILAIRMVNSLDHCVEALISRK